MKKIEIFEDDKYATPELKSVDLFETHQLAIEAAYIFAKKYTRRKHILTITDSQSNLSALPAGDAAKLCEAIATSLDRIAAIVLSYTDSTPYYHKKLRELSSAEGAILILDIALKEFSKETYFHRLIKLTQPDVICFKHHYQYAIGWLRIRKNFDE